MRSILSTALLLYIGLCSAASAQLLDAYLPKSGVIAGQAMELGATPEVVRISAKLQAAIQKNQAWFTSYAAKVKEGDPLPYDRRLGVTRAEYDRMMNAKMVLTPKAAVSIKVKTDAQGNLEFASEGIAAALNGVRVPAGQKYAETPYGRLATFSEVFQDDDDSPAGRWRGVQWKKDDAPVAKLAIGRREKTGDGILYYDVGATAKGPEQTLIVIYRLD